MSSVKDTNPDDLLNHFRGRSLKSILIFTLLVHVVVIGGTSIPFLIKHFNEADTEKLSEEERINIAVKETTSAMREIAEAHGLQPQTLSEQFGTSKRPTPEPEATTAPEPEEAPEEQPETPGNETAPESPEREKSDYEKDLEKEIPGPDLPPVEESDDLFE